ncbi:MAG: colanic acid biosynthesis glycosyltransferase WcaL [Pseudomonas sp.]|nr:colanic acid biosynthesis glycosyltransferase WcaL [Pseudomonas sp.]|tara:strand:- start:1798 stop:3015 length:1218 start_codon:yes stop_codon:yes gene_type:complete
MRLLFFVTTFPNPSETFIISQIAGMIDRGFDVDIYALSPGDLNNTHELIEDYHLMDRVIYLNQPNLTGVRKFASRLGRIIKSTLTKPSTIKGLNIIRYGRAAASLGLASAAKDLSWKHYDAVIAHFGYAGVYAQKLVDSGILNAKLYPVFHGVELSDERYLSKYRNDYKKLFETSEKVIAISELWCERLINLGCPKEKITLNRMGVDIKRFEFRNKEVTNDRLKVLTTGRLVEKKGVEYAIKAIAKLKEAGTQVEYKIIGDGPLKENLIALSNDLGLNDEVQFLGFCSQNKVKELLQESDVFLLPSVTSKTGDMEGVPVALMEAMAIGLITVSTYHSGIPELIEDRVSGFLAPERDYTEIASIISQCCTDRELCGEVRSNARIKILEEYNHDAIYDELAFLLRGV